MQSAAPIKAPTISRLLNAAVGANTAGDVASKKGGRVFMFGP